MWEDFPDAEEDQAPDNTVEISAAKRAGADPWAAFPDAEGTKDEWAAFPDVDEKKSSAAGAAGRSFAESVLPSAAGIAVGIPVGSVLSAGATPFVGVPAGIGAGVAASYAVSKAQDEFLRWLGIREGEGPFSDVQRRADEAEHPYASLAGSLAPNVAAFGTGIGKGLPLAARAFGGGLQGGMEAAQEYATKGEVDWKKALLAGAVGTVFAQPRKFLAPLDPSMRARVPEQPEPPRAPSPEMPASAEIADRIRRQTYERPGMFEDEVVPAPRRPEPDLETMYPDLNPEANYRPGRPDEALTPGAAEIKKEATVPPAPVAQSVGIASEHGPAPTRNVGNEVGAQMAARTAAKPNEPARNYAKDATPAEPAAVERVQVVPDEVSAAVRKTPIEKPPTTAEDAFAVMRAKEQPRPPDAKEVTATVKPEDQALIDRALSQLKVSPRALEEIKAKLEAYPPQERVAAARKFFDDVARYEAAAATAAKRPRVQGEGVTKDIQARDRADAAKKSGIVKLANDVFNHFTVDKHPFDPNAGIKEVRDFANRVYKTALMANKNVDPFMNYRAPRGLSPATDWLYAARDVVRAPTRENIQNFLSAHYLRGEVGPNIEGNLALSRRPDIETVGRAAEPETRQPISQFFDAGVSAKEAAAQNRLRTWFNKLSPEDYKLLKGLHGSDLEVTVKTPSDPVKTLEALKRDLAEAQMANRPGTLEYPAGEPGAGIKREVKTAADLPAKATGRTLDLSTPEGKAAATAALKARERPKGRLLESLEQFAKSEVGSVGGTPGVNQPLINRAPRTTGPYDQEGFLKTAKVPILKRVRNTDRLAQAVDHLFGGPEKNPFRKYARALMQGEVRARELHRESAPLLESIQEAKRVTPKEFAEVEKLVFDETWWQRWADRDLNNQGFSTTGLRAARANAAHADLEARYNALTPEMKDLRTKMHEFFQTRHDEVVQKTGENRLLKEVGIDDDAMVARILDGQETAADRARLGATPREQDTVIETIREVADLSKVKGPYVPLSHGAGDWAVAGRRKIVSPSTGRQLGPKDFEFVDPKDAAAFADKQDGMATTIHSYTVNKNTGERYYKGVVDGVEKEFAYTKGDPDTETRYAVHVENGYLRFFPTQRDAIAHERAQRASGDFEDKSVYMEPRKHVSTEGSRLANDLASVAMQRLSNSALYSGMSDKQKAVVKQALTEAAMQKMAATRVHSSKLQRRGVGGYEEDLGRALWLYSNETANRIATLEARPKVDAAMAEASDMIEAARANAPDKAPAMRGVMNEFERRLEHLGKDGNLSAARMSPAVQRTLSLAYMARLATPAYSIANMTQPSLVTYPFLGAEYGYGQAGKAMVQAYKDLGITKILGAGFKETGQAAKGEVPRSTVIEDLKARLTDPQERAAIDYAIKEGIISPDAGFPIEQFRQSYEGVRLDIGRRTTKAHDYADTAATYGDKALQYMEEVSRALPRAVEAANRAVSMLSAFRLELAKNGGNAEKAMAKAAEIASNTQINYSDLMKAPVMRGNYARFPLQFKQFGIGMAENIGGQIMKAVRNANPGDRAMALKTLAGLAATHGSVAGLLGLPGWELAKAFLIGAKAAGLSGVDYDEMETALRKKVAEGLSAFGGQQFGKIAGEALMKGMPRLLGMDFSGRLGLDNMLLFGSPRSGSDAEFSTNLQAWLFSLVGGAPAATGIQMAEGLRDILSGDLEKGLGKAMPLKLASDVIKAYQGVTEGKRDKRGRETMKPYSAPEAVMRVLGIIPAREAEVGRFRSAVYGRGKEQSEQQSKLIGAWIKAAPDAKGKAFQAAIQAGITPATLLQSLRRHQLEARRTIEGVVTTKRTAPIARDLSQVYNLR